MHTAQRVEILLTQHLDKNVRTFIHLLKQLVKAVIPYIIHNVIDYSNPCCYNLVSDIIGMIRLVALSFTSRKFELVGQISINKGKEKYLDIILIFRFHPKTENHKNEIVSNTREGRAGTKMQKYYSRRKNLA